MRPNWIDRVTAPIAPIWTLRRQKARLALEMVRHFDAASPGRRTQGWRRSGDDANATVGPHLKTLREHARELVRNNPYAESALTTICDQGIGWGITGKPATPNPRAQEAWNRWAESTDCDADGRNDIYGLQKLVMRTVVESGECLIRRRLRRPTDGFALPMQLQILEPDYLDTNKDSRLFGGDGNIIIQGKEYNRIGQVVAYWLFPEHPGSSSTIFSTSQRIPAENVRHVFKPLRPGQVRGLTWFAPVLLRFKDFDEMEDAVLMKQKIAACLAVLTTDPNGEGQSLGTADDTKTPGWDSLMPGAILNVAPGRDVQVVTPPTTADYPDYVKTVLRAIATGIGVTYEDLTGDYQNLPFSAARMSRIRQWSRVDDWRWRLMVPQFCDPVWKWAMEIAAIDNQVDSAAVPVDWTTQPAPMIDPVNEGLAYSRNIRNGIQTLPDVLRERGYDPAAVMAEYKQSNADIDKLGLILDSDPRYMTQAGQLQGSAAAAAKTETTKPAATSVEEDDEDEERRLAAQGWPRR